MCDCGAVWAGWFATASEKDSTNSGNLCPVLTHVKSTEHKVRWFPAIMATQHYLYIEQKPHVGLTATSNQIQDTLRNNTFSDLSTLGSPHLFMEVSYRIITDWQQSKQLPFQVRKLECTWILFCICPHIRQVALLPQCDTQWFRYTCCEGSYTKQQFFRGMFQCWWSLDVNGNVQIWGWISSYLCSYVHSVSSLYCAYL